MRDLQKDLEICQAATPGPWTYTGGRVPKINGGPVGGCSVATLLFATDKDGRFIAESREALPYWLQRVKELEKENAVLEAGISFVSRTAERRLAAAKEALEKLKNLLPEFGGLDGRVWRIIDEALAVLRGGEQNA